MDVVLKLFGASESSYENDCIDHSMELCTVYTSKHPRQISKGTTVHNHIFRATVRAQGHSFQTTYVASNLMSFCTMNTARQFWGYTVETYVGIGVYFFAVVTVDISPEESTGAKYRC